MKNLTAVLAGVLLAVPLCSASTCQTRVDSNLDKSTTEKVQRCLTQEPETEQTKAGSEVIFSETHEVIYPKKSNTKSLPKDTKTFQKYTPSEVHQVYVDQASYPLFRNDTLPISSAKQADDTALQALKEQRNLAIQKNEESKTKLTIKKTHKQKPNRKVILPAVQPETAPSQTTPPEEIQQAEALQNDPLAPQQNDTAPAGFENSVLSPADFGYNATDPAFQQ